jgi:hypothetical protein
MMMNKTATRLRRPEKQEVLADMFWRVFEQNPDTRMTLREIEACLPAGVVEAFSPSTRQRALYVLMHRLGRGVIQYESTYPPEGPEPNIYWMPVKEAV